MDESDYTKLIANIKKYPPIWDKKFDAPEKSIAWKTIKVVEYQNKISCSTLQSAWKKLFNQFNAEHKRLMKFHGNASGEFNNRSTWKHYKDLIFLVNEKDKMDENLWVGINKTEFIADIKEQKIIWAKEKEPVQLKNKVNSLHLVWSKLAEKYQKPIKNLRQNWNALSHLFFMTYYHLKVAYDEAVNDDSYLKFIYDDPIFNHLFFLVKSMFGIRISEDDLKAIENLKFNGQVKKSQLKCIFQVVDEANLSHTLSNTVDNVITPKKIGIDLNNSVKNSNIPLAYQAIFKKSVRVNVKRLQIAKFVDKKSTGCRKSTENRKLSNNHQSVIEIHQPTENQSSAENHQSAQDLQSAMNCETIENHQPTEDQSSAENHQSVQDLQLPMDDQPTDHQSPENLHSLQNLQSIMDRESTENDQPAQDLDSTMNQQPTGRAKTPCTIIDYDEIFGDKSSKEAPESLADSSENSTNVRSLLNETIKLMKRIESSLKISNDADLCFLLSLHPFLKQMTDTQKLSVRIKMVNCLLSENE